MFFLLLLAIRLDAKFFSIDIEKTDVAPDGFPSQMLAFNRSFMTPIIVDKGDDVTIVFNNKMDEGTTVHYHGIFQNGSNWVSIVLLMT